MADIHLKVGQIWRVVDPRFKRYLRIENGCGDHHFMVRTVAKHPDCGCWVETFSSRERQVKASRFNGKSGGYELVEEPT